MTALSKVITAGAIPIDDADYTARMHRAMTYNLPSVKSLLGKYAGQKLVICGSGASIKSPETLAELRAHSKNRNTKLIAPNRSHDFLVSLRTNGQSTPIVPDFSIVIDHSVRASTYVERPHKGCTYILGHTCDQATFEAMAHLKPYLMYVFNDRGEPEFLRENYRHKDWCFIEGKSTVGLRCLSLGYHLGFREMHLYGFDSSYSGNDLYGVKKPFINETRQHGFRIATPDGKWWRDFRSNTDMGRQVNEFIDFCFETDEQIKAGRIQPFKIVVHGDGALPYNAAIMEYPGGVVSHAEGREAFLERTSNPGPVPALSDEAPVMEPVGFTPLPVVA